ncbi:MAG: AAA family ATPase, partial [Leptospira sp.]|nr:AAA family ATPase [Leptospira sp.]
MKSKNPEKPNSPTSNEILLKRISYLKNLNPEESNLFQEILEETNKGNLAFANAIDTKIPSEIQSPIFAKREINGTHFFFFQKDFEELRRLESHLKNFLKPVSTTTIDKRKLHEELESLQKNFRKNSGNQNFELTDEQTGAIGGICTFKFHLITGGPGTGKTSVISFLLKVMEKMEILPNPKDIVLVAPTGRAAQRLTESIQRNLSQMEPENLIYNSFKGQTLHSLLKLNPRTGIPKFGTERYLTQKLFILDEISMVDLKMMNLFLDAMKEGNQIILLGDPHQLPSVEKGNVISDLTNVLEGKSNFLSKLTISKRFDDSSSLSKISKQIQISFNTDLSPHTITAIPMDSLEIGAFKPKDKNIYWLDGLKPKDRQIQRNEMIDFLWKDVFWPEVLQIHNWKVTKD